MNKYSNAINRRYFDRSIHTRLVEPRQHQSTSFREIFNRDRRRQTRVNSGLSILMAELIEFGDWIVYVAPVGVS